VTTDPGSEAGDREARLALNEAIARDANELVDDVAAGWFDPDEAVTFRCECVRSDCVELIALTREEYASVRESPVQFIVVPGHEEPDVEEVVGHMRVYPLVRKLGPGADVARATAPD
jgi:hypothetical protein